MHSRCAPPRISARRRLGRSLADRPPADLREPVVERREAAEGEPTRTHDRVLLGGDRVLELPSDRDHRRRQLAGEPEDQRADRGREREDQRRPQLRARRPRASPIQLKKRRPIGTSSPIAAAIAKYWKPSRDRRRRTCSASRRARQARRSRRTEPAAAVWLKSGLREKVGTISEMIADRADHEDRVDAGEEDPAQVREQERLAALARVEEDAVEVAVDGEHRERGEHHGPAPAACSRSRVARPGEDRQRAATPCRARAGSGGSRSG